MRARENELAATGARLVFVGSGLPAMAADFARSHAGTHEVLSDIERRAFAAAGMKRSLGAFLRPRFWGNVVRALRAGFRQKGVHGDPWQQGGVLVFDPRGALRHAQIDAAAGDALDLGAVIEAARGC